MTFADRRDAGTRLARRLRHLAGEDVVVLGLPPRGVPVASAVSAALGAPLDVVVARELRAPSRPRAVLGAVGEDGALVLDHAVVSDAGVGEAELAETERRARAVLDRRTRRYRAAREPEPLTGRTVVLVDDGIATATSARAAVRVARARGAGRVVLAVPVCAPAVAADLAEEVDEIVVLARPSPFRTIGESYVDSSWVGDDEVAEALRRRATEVSTLRA
jgi:putative phosphoribosyl transferase